MKSEITYKDFKPYRKLYFVNLMLDRLKLHPVVIGILAYAGYYFGTLIISLINKVLFTPEKLSNYNIPEFLKEPFGTYINSDCTLSFFNDISHFTFATFVVLPGTIISMYFLKTLPLLLKDFVENEIITSPIEDVNTLFQRFQKQANNNFVHIVIIIMSIIGLVIFLGFTSNTNFVNWWGNINYGWGGIYLALVIAIMLYHGIYILYISYLFVRFIKKLMTLSIKLRPFHPDASNGYKPLGSIILILFGISIIIAIAVFIVLYLGFLDLQKTVFIWILILACLTLTPLLLLLPSYYVVTKLKSEKNKLLQIIEKRMNHITMELEKQLEDVDGVAFHAKIDDLLKVRDSFSIYNGITIWPYNIRLIQTIVLTYVLQIALLLYESIN